MPDTVTRIHIASIPGLVGYVILWIILCESARMLATVLRNDPLIGWAVGPLGISTLFLSEPSVVFILFNALFPAAISASVLYFVPEIFWMSYVTCGIHCGERLVSYVAFNYYEQVGPPSILLPLASLTCVTISALVQLNYYGPCK